MTGDSRCRGPAEMIGTEEQPSPATSPAPANFPAPENSPEKFEGVDLYSQARKALSERSPFDSSEVIASTVATLPSGLASLLSKHADSRRKHKRPHSDTKSNRKGSTEKSKSSNIWVELDDYFRELTLQDIEVLCRLASSFASCSSTSDSCFSIPVVGNAARNDKDRDNAAHGVNVQAVVAKQEEIVCADDRVSDCGGAEIPEVNGEIEQLHDGKVESGDRNSLAIVENEQSSVVPQEQVYSSQSCSSVEWVLGSRNRVLLTTTRPTKKRKLLGETAGLEKLIVAQPCEGSSSLCHVCSMGDTGDQMNQFVVCSSCSVVVHQKCYGVQGEVYGSWLCAWCKHIDEGKAGQVHSSDSRPCALCPKTGGAVKRFQRAGGESTEFAHLFCSQWMPEVYIEDTRLMEPLLSVEEIKDVRGKLLCNLCKVRHGSCIRCSDGSCRTSFHPICAREARNKLEVWGKFGCDDIELRAFCTKHSGCVDPVVKSEQTHAVAGDSVAASYQPAVLSVNKIKKLKIGCKNGEKVTLNIGAADSKPSNLGKCESQEMVHKDASTNLKPVLGDAHRMNSMEPLERNLSENVKSSRLDLGLVLEKLIDRGKVSLQQIALDIGISADSLASKIAGNHLGAELYSKIIMWLRDHAYMDTKVKSLIPSKAMLGADDSSEAAALSDLDIPDVVPVKSVPSRRRTVGKIGILKEDELISCLDDNLSGSVVSAGEGMDQEQSTDGVDKSNSVSISNSNDKIVVDTMEFEDHLEEPSATSEGPQLKSNNLCDVERNGSEEGTDSGKSSLVDMDLDIPSSSVDALSHYEGDIKRGAESLVHPYIQKKLEEVRSWLSQAMPLKYDGCVEHKFSSTEQSSDVSIGCNDKNLPVSLVEDEKRNVVNANDLQYSKHMGTMDLCPENELEGEIIFYQQRLLDNAMVQKHHADQLVCKVVRNLPHQMDAVRKQRWDDVLVNQYVHELKEARKQGRKEKKYKEAQAVLAAATAAAAASSRTSLRKDTVDECLQENQLKLGSTRARGQQSVSVPRVKETHASSGISKVMSDKFTDNSRLVSGSPKGQPRSCDICSRPESLLNPILVCSSCKVAIHLNCYRSIKETTGPWYCELCEESPLPKSISTAVLNSAHHPVTECGLCGTSAGAFRKSSNGEWVHAFCAEWVLDSTFKRGQVHPVEGMETVLKGNDVCSVCDRRHGVCIKCNYGNCQATFHPSCARSAGYYLYARNIGGGKTQRKAYCSKHSMEQRSKVETQKHAAEDLKIVKQHRVKLEKLRLLCERIVKREKLKRDLVICSHDILSSKRDSLAVSMPVRHPYLSHEVSSESATTSLKGNTDGSRSCSEAIQKSDDVTVDSAVSGKKCIRLPVPMENDQKTDDSSTSQNLPPPKPTDRVSFGGKQIPIRAAMACRNFSQKGENKSKKHTETFKKELVMTSDQALMKNQRLPKGYIYVPMKSLSNGKQVTRDADEKKEGDG